MSKRKAGPSDFEQLTTQQKMQRIHDHADVRKPPKPPRDRKKMRKMILCVLSYILAYILLLAILFGMIVLNDVRGWTTYMREQLSDVLFLIVSTFFLVVIVFFYYFFEDRELLVSTANTLLIFSLFFLCSIICFLFGKYVSPYARPFALFSLLALFLLNRRQAIFLNFIFTIQCVS